MLNNHINYAQEAQDRAIQSMHHQITSKRNAAYAALDREDYTEYSRLMKESEVLSEKLGAM